MADYYGDPNTLAISGADVQIVPSRFNDSGKLVIDVSGVAWNTNAVVYVEIDKKYTNGSIQVIGVESIESFNNIKGFILNFSQGFSFTAGGLSLYSDQEHKLTDLNASQQKEDKVVSKAAEKFIFNLNDGNANSDIIYEDAHVGRTIAPNAKVIIGTNRVGWPKVAAKIIDFQNVPVDYTEMPETVEPFPDPENPEEPEDSNTVEEAVAYLKPASGQEPDEKIDLTQKKPRMSGLMVNQDVNYEIKWQNEEYKLFYRSGDNGAWQPLTSGGTTHYVGSDKLDKLVVTPANNDATKIVVADLPYDADQKFTFAPEAQKIQFALTKAEEPGAEDWHSEWLTLQPGKFEMIVPRLRFGTHKIPEAGQTTKVTAKDAKIQVSDTLKPFFTLSAKINSDRTSVLTEPRNLRAHRQDNLVRYFPSDQPDSSLVFCLMQQDYSFDGDFVFEIKSTYTPTEHRAKIIWTLTTTFNGSKGVIPAAA